MCSLLAAILLLWLTLEFYIFTYVYSFGKLPKECTLAFDYEYYLNTTLGVCGGPTRDLVKI